MSNTIDVGEVQSKVKEYFNFEKMIMLGIHEQDGSYITVMDESLEDIELVYMISALEEARKKRVKSE